MSDLYKNESMLDLYLFETTQLIKQLEEIVMDVERSSNLSINIINEIFRIMHTIKGSSAMMMFDNITSMAHNMEDIFYYLREEKPEQVNCSKLADLVLNAIDFIDTEINKIQNGHPPDGNGDAIVDLLKEFLSALKNHEGRNASKIEEEQKLEDKKQLNICKENEEAIKYKNAFKAVIYYTPGCEMENIRAFAVINNLKKLTKEYTCIPNNLKDNDSSIQEIRDNGFQIYFRTDYDYDNVELFFQEIIFLKELLLKQYTDEDEYEEDLAKVAISEQGIDKKYNRELDEDRNRNDMHINNNPTSATQSIISVNVGKLDKLMDLVGEIVISQAMVIQNPDLKGLNLDNFNKAARQHSKIINELQDIVMSVRMIPLTTTFQKMHRIIRDMSKKLHKEVKLDMYGDETEVDKNIIEHISDPLMHIVRNALDHGIETPEERLAKGKNRQGIITLEAKNAGSAVIISIKDDGRGLDKKKIYNKAVENGITNKKIEALSDKEIYNMVLLPGFSTNDNVTEFSGRGVGMDVVSKNVDKIGGSLSVDSKEGLGTTIMINIPLSLTIIEGMNIRVGRSNFTIPVNAVKEAFRIKKEDMIHDPDGNEMVMVRGNCYPLVKLYELYHLDTDIDNYEKGIIMMIEQENRIICIFVDEMLDKQQVVVKTLPKYIQDFKRVRNITGCTLMGDGSISLILDSAALINSLYK